MKQSDTRMQAIPAVYTQEKAALLLRSTEAEREKQETTTYRKTAKARIPLLLRRLVGNKTVKYQIRNGVKIATKIGHENFTFVKE